MNLGENIKTIRLLKGLSQQAFGEILGVSKDAVYTYEIGRIKPKPVMLAKIAGMAGVTIKELKTQELKDLDINVINPDTKEVEFTLNNTTKAMEVLQRELELKEALIQSQKELIETLKELISKQKEKR